MDLSSALDWLYSTQLFGIKLGLEGTERLLDAADAYPGAGVKIVHVAGTNGKGSTCAMVEAIAREEGMTTGLFTSPHLVDFRERIRVDGEMIPAEDLLRILLHIKGIVSDWNPHPTFFELTLAIALCWFKECGVDLIVLETGLGGRLDATNAVPKDVAVLAPIGMDHQQYLGDTLGEIATEKAGIIESNKPVVSAQQEDEALDVIIGTAIEKNAVLTLVQGNSDVVPSLKGMHQRQNAALAIEALRVIGCLPPEDSVVYALSHLKWTGRFDIMGNRVLDGAHNPHAAKVLSETWRECFGEERASLVFAASADKNIHGVLELLAPLAGEWHLVPCTSPRILPVGEMEALVRAHSSSPVVCHGSLAAGLASADASGRKILVTGSLFLLGDVLALQSLPDGEIRRSTAQ